MVTILRGVIGPSAVSRVVVELKLVLEPAPTPLQKPTEKPAMPWVQRQNHWSVTPTNAVCVLDLSGIFLPCFVVVVVVFFLSVLHPGTRLMIFLEMNTKKTQSHGGIVRLTVEWFLKTIKQSVGLTEHGLQISLRRYALSMEDKMAVGTFGRARNYGYFEQFNYRVPGCKQQTKE